MHCLSICLNYSQRCSPFPNIMAADHWCLSLSMQVYANSYTYLGWLLNNCIHVLGLLPVFVKCFCPVFPPTWIPLPAHPPNLHPRHTLRWAYRSLDDDCFSFCSFLLYCAYYIYADDREPYMCVRTYIYAYTCIHVSSIIQSLFFHISVLSGNQG